MRKEVILEKMRTKITKGQEWMLDNIQYLTIMGSHAYQTNHENSDFDVYGITIPPIEYVFPKTLMLGFDKFPIFNQFEGNIKEGKKKEHLDWQIYNITKYFSLVFDNNPNMIDSLFTPENCVLIQTDIGKMIRDNRKLFLHKGSFHKFKGYSFSQLRKIRTNPNDRKSPERKKSIETYGYDTKFAVHLFRLLGECEQILSEGDLTLGRNREELKLVLKGFYTLEEIEQKFKEKEIYLEKLYQESTLPWGREENQDKVRELLVTCLTKFYASN